MRDAHGPLTPSNARRLAEARDWLHRQAADLLSEQIEIARIPAPPFKERDRSEELAARLRGLGAEAQYDEVGNLLAWFPARPAPPHPTPVVVAAHMDTVFGPEIPIQIHRADERWVGPGVTDNARGVAVTLAVLRALTRARPEPHHPILFAFTVGEEGPGDLRGVKHLFQNGKPLRDAAAFIAVDGSGLRRIIHHALGSRRFRVVLRGAGGHSWTDWGRVNPANALGEFIHRLLRTPLPRSPRSALTVARLGGGTVINAIPDHSWVELDLRSEANETLRRLEAQLREALRQAVDIEEERGEGSLSVAVELLGERPAGSLAASHTLVQAAAQATRACGEEPELTVSSTDANVPLALGIPAIAVGGGGRSGDTHTPNEWFEDVDGAAGALRLLAILQSVAQF